MRSAMILAILMSVLAAGSPSSTEDTVAELRVRLSAAIAASDESCVFTMRQKRIVRIFESREALASDPIANELSRGLDARLVLEPEHSQRRKDISESMLADPKASPDWERTEQVVRVVHSPGAVLQSSQRSGFEHHDFLTDGLFISSSWQSRQVTVTPGPSPIVRYGPSYLTAPLNLGREPAKWFGSQSWRRISGSGGTTLRLDFPGVSGAFEILHVASESERISQVLVYYGDGDLVSTYLEYWPTGESEARIPRRSLRLSCAPRQIEILELTVSDWSADPPDAAFRVPVPTTWRLVDKRPGSVGIRTFGVDESAWPADLRSLLLGRAPEAPNSTPR